MVRINLPNRLKSYGSSHRQTYSGTPSRNSSPTGLRDGKNATSLVLKLNVIKARNLAAMDRCGTSDPFLVVNLGDAKSVTHAVNKTLNPEWNSTFELPITGVESLMLDCICWDKDRFGKDYLGEFDLALDEVFARGNTVLEPKWYTLKSKRKSTKITGEIQLQFSLIDPTNPSASPQELITKLKALVLDHNSTSEDDVELDRTSSGELDDEDDDDHEGSDETDDPLHPESEEKKKKRRLRVARLRKKKAARAYELVGESNVVGIVYLEIGSITDLPPEKNVTRTSFDMDPFVVASLGKNTYRTRVIRHNLNPVFDEKMIFQVHSHETNYSFNFAVVDRDKLSGNDFVGTTDLSLPDLINAAPEADTDTGLYHLKEPPADLNLLTPSASKSRFRLPMSRTTSSTSLSKIGRPSLRSRNSSSNLTPQTAHSDQPPASTSAPISAPTGASLTPETSLTGEKSPALPILVDDEHVNDTGEADHDADLKQYVLALNLKHKERWEDKHKPELFIRAKYVPYTALRQKFWRCMLKQYDADESGMISKVELSTMLDTLGSTLRENTINGFFERFAEAQGATDITAMELTFDQVVICLEDALIDTSQKQSIGSRLRAHIPPQILHPVHGNSTNGDSELSTSTVNTPTNSQSTTSVPTISTTTLGTAGEEGDLLEKDDLGDDKGEEHVVEIRECPICHQPRLHKRSDADIITHIATCASQDWRQVNNLVMAGFVTSSQAQRKWYSKVITKISYGGYKLGANSANILVQDRITGQINEERMSVYVRLGIRLLYKGLKSRDMEKKRIRKLLKSLSIKQGVKFDDPASAREIEGFIAFHQLDMGEVLLPLNSFKSFNEFFYRALKPNARPCSAPENSKIIVSPADCRSVVFNRLDDATSIWVKGREFSIARLLGDAYPEDAKRYAGGALGIFRLAPQDYHRFHIPVDGVMGAPKLIKGEYYTVNPMAIRSALDVYGENIRIIVPIDSVEHGRVMVICVGAMMVGSTVITAEAGSKVSRAQELGYFKFGGSTILTLFEPGRMVFDSDLVDNSKGALETLIRVGMSIGHSPEQAAHTPDMQKENVTRAERDEAKRRIGGSLGSDPDTLPQDQGTPKPPTAALMS
ncbi:MAG: hypothetical protein M1814_000824 [Vezdaea aestivalis]|nr:MAG: hypothetical protein M1814_000824 [Vezdaea aestivalis]